MSWSSFSRTGRDRTGTTFSWASMDGIGRTSGTIPGANTFSRSDEGNLLALHPTPKPVTLIADAIKDCTARGDLVSIRFLGSGTAVIAAERSGRRCYGVELDPLYVDTIIRRWQRQTKLEAVHVETGETFNSRDHERGQ